MPNHVGLSVLIAFTEHPHERVRVQDPDQPAEIASLGICVRLARPGVRNALGDLVASKPTFDLLLIERLDERVVQVRDRMLGDERAELFEARERRWLLPTIIRLGGRLLEARLDQILILTRRALTGEAEQRQSREHFFQAPDKRHLVQSELFVLPLIIFITDLVGADPLSVLLLEKRTMIPALGVLAPVEAHAGDVQGNSRAHFCSCDRSASYRALTRVTG